MTRALYRPGCGPVSDPEHTRRALIEETLRAIEKRPARYASDYDPLTFERLADHSNQGGSFDQYSLESSAGRLTARLDRHSGGRKPAQ